MQCGRKDTSDLIRPDLICPDLTCSANRFRLNEVYSVVDKDFKDGGIGNGDGDNEDVDEHHQHATVLRQLQHLKSSVTVRVYKTARRPH